MHFWQRTLLREVAYRGEGGVEELESKFLRRQRIQWYIEMCNKM